MRWSSPMAFYLGAAGAAVGLGSIWRFPYLAGEGGGSAFIIIFALACILITTPLLAAEAAIGRASRRSPPKAAGFVALANGRTSRWNAIGILGALAAFLIFSYYTVIASWVFAYTWKCAIGVLSAAGAIGVSTLWHGFVSNPIEVGAWHVGFLFLVVAISSLGLNSGIEVANRIRAPGLLLLLSILVVYSLTTGDVARGLSFAFRPNFSAVTGKVVLAAVGQAFYATGVGQAMMLAYGAYASHGTSLIRTSFVVSGSILLVSLLSTLMIFPLVFGYKMDPAQGAQLVFEVLPRAFTEMPAGRLIGTLFFLLLLLAALIPSIAMLEPAVAWFNEKTGVSRTAGVCIVALFAWVIGIGSILSFNERFAIHPLAFIPGFADKTLFDSLDYIASNILQVGGALLTSVFVGWRLSEAFPNQELAETTPFARNACIWLLRYVCPIAILAVFTAAALS